MKQVVFTHHANARCKRRKVNPQDVIELVQSLPAARGSFKWKTERFGVVFTSEADRFIIITVL